MPRIQVRHLLYGGIAMLGWAPIVTFRQTPMLAGTHEQPPAQTSQNYSIAMNDTSDPWKTELIQRLERIRQACGALCDLNTVEDLKAASHTSSYPQWRHIRVSPVPCHTILVSEDIDAADHSVPAYPDELLPFYELGGPIRITQHKRRSDIYLGKESETSLWKTGSLWKEDDVNEAVRQAGLGTLEGSYGINATTDVRDRLAALPIRGTSILVIGSSHPWLEATLLHHGARLVTTLEYGTIRSEHPQIHTLTPVEFRERYLNKTLGQFDGVVSHSSIEHSGLGRYGDALNPWGDILAVARAWCVVRDEGFMYLGVPTGIDKVMSNWHRIYGKHRWPLLTTNWELTSVPGDELERGIWKSGINGGWGYTFRRLAAQTT